MLQYKYELVDTIELGYFFSDDLGKIRKMNQTARYYSSAKNRWVVHFTLPRGFLNRRLLYSSYTFSLSVILLRMHRSVRFLC